MMNTGVSRHQEDLQGNYPPVEKNIISTTCAGIVHFWKIAFLLRFELPKLDSQYEALASKQLA